MVTTRVCVWCVCVWLVGAGRTDLRPASRNRPPASQGVNEPPPRTDLHGLGLFVWAGDTPAVIVSEEIYCSLKVRKNRCRSHVLRGCGPLKNCSLGGFGTLRHLPSVVSGGQIWCNLKGWSRFQPRESGSAPSASMRYFVYKQPRNIQPWLSHLDVVRHLVVEAEHSK